MIISRSKPKSAAATDGPDKVKISKDCKKFSDFLIFRLKEVFYTKQTAPNYYVRWFVYESSNYYFLQ